jgi:ribosomal 50S subunit-associated protein YjgA (DUF615 family)
MMTDTEIRKIVSDVMRERFANLGLMDSDVAFEEDFDGEKIVRVTAHFERREDVGEALFDAADTIRARLIKAGDDRFVFVRRDYPGSSREEESDEEPEQTRTS